MTRVTFLLSKDPVLEHAGDIEMSRLVIRLAAEAFDVSVVCLSRETGSAVADVVVPGLPLTRIRKWQVQPARILIDSLRTRRSLVHVRFDGDSLLAGIEAADADVFVAEHSYMAETFIRSSKFGMKRLVVNTVNTESQVWRATRGVLGRFEAPRLLRDEIRVGRACDAIGTYDADEAEMYRQNGARYARWMDITLPPVAQVAVSATPRRLVLVGTRQWPPNQEAFLKALQLWPRIADGIPNAELCIVGAKKPGAKDPAYPDGVRDLGFVDDLRGFLATCRASIAPVKTGGGVRVKVLDAASRGLPVVGTGPAMGSLGPLFGLPTFDDDEAFVDECRRHLLDRDAAARDGNRLYETNRDLWADRRPHRAVEELLSAGSRRFSST
jgi:polysaccharide biosynthesis protein PslH